MAVAGWSPLMKSVTVGATALQLSALIAAIDPNFPTRCVLVRIELDLSNAGTLYVGNSDVSATNCGFKLVATQSANFAVFDSGLVLTTDIWLRASQAAQQVNITVLGFGM
jgi:hypothetical protein